MKNILYQPFISCNGFTGYTKKSIITLNKWYTYNVIILKT